ncbi:phosphopyruvate hydratase [Dactylosporangium sp. CA-233914]|uniref:phosphopyruvate hydratase n=1 Tax=Dactylosporangium sp. CA-233914 TaxID=3239934 RepID=UPI003D915BFA
MTRITEVIARQVLDCKARPMVEVDLVTASGHLGRGAAPTGSSVGAHEAVVLRDGDPGDYRGLSVHTAVRNVLDEIVPAIIGRDIVDQEGFDRILIDLDGTSDKSRLGANAVYSASVAFLRAQAHEAGQPVYRHIAREPLRSIPVPAFNMINGGRAGDVVQPFNEFLAVPVGARDIDEAVQMGVTLFAVLGEVLTRFAARPPSVGGSYGYLAPSCDPGVVLALMEDAVVEAGYAGRVAFALDCASSEFYDRERGTYRYADAEVTGAELIERVRCLSLNHDLLFVEDLLDEDDWAGFTLAKQVLDRTLILGDDLIVTNRDRLERAIAEAAVDGFVLKPNQVGTISEALDTHELARRNGILSTPSGRSGGVVDDIVMDLSVGLQAPFQKNGAPRSGERIEKLNFLIRAAQKIAGAELARLDDLARFGPGPAAGSSPPDR